MAWQAGRRANSQDLDHDMAGVTGEAPLAQHWQNWQDLAGPGSSCRSVATLVHFLSPLPAHGADL